MHEKPHIYPKRLIDITHMIFNIYRQHQWFAVFFVCFICKVSLGFLVEFVQEKGESFHLQRQDENKKKMLTNMVL